MEELIQKLIQVGFYAQFGLTVPPEWDWPMLEHDAYDHAQIIKGCPNIIPFKGDYIPATPYGEIWATCSEYARAEAIHGHKRFFKEPLFAEWLNSAIELAKIQGWNGVGLLPTLADYKIMVAYWEYYFQ